MNDNVATRLTDNDVVKALECCSAGECRFCTYDAHNRVGGLGVKFFDDKCKPHIAKDTLDLIKRQQEEIERLQNALMGECMLTSCPLKKEIKSEAIKEFAERMKDIVDEPALIRSRVIDTIIARIDNLVREMTEGENNG